MALRLVLAFGGITAILGLVLLYAGTDAGLWVVLAGFPVAVVVAVLYQRPLRGHRGRSGSTPAT
jgi:membrane protein implicated in regulation of membrane protease activity